MRCLLSKSLLDRGFFSNKKDPNDNCKETQVPNYNWCGERKTPSYLKKLVFPEEFLTCLRTIAMREDEISRASSLLQEVNTLISALTYLVIFKYLETFYVCS